eukprot:SAG11_NODE_4882_length_1735_cov_2.192543_2_plen_93_part_00
MVAAFWAEVKIRTRQHAAKSNSRHDSAFAPLVTLTRAIDRLESPVITRCERGLSDLALCCTLAGVFPPKNQGMEACKKIEECAAREDFCDEG